MILALLAIGFVSLLAQVVLLRELSVAFFGSELIYILALGFWLLGTAAGAFARAKQSRLVPSAAGIARLFLAAGILVPLAVVWARGARVVLRGMPGAYLPFPTQMLAMAAALLPLSFTFGLLFQRTARRAVGGGRTLASAYALESTGALAGGAAATLILRAGLPDLFAALLCALVATAMAAGLAWPRLVPALSWAVCLLVALNLAPRIDRATTRWTHPGLLATRDSPYGRVSLTDWGGQINVFTNDALAYETGGTAAEEFVHVVALEHPDPRRILILGGGAAGLVREALQHRPLAIDSVELDPVLQQMLVEHLPPDLRAPLSAPGVRTLAGDPRRFLTEGAAAYDLILVGMPEPSSGQANRYYTREFFAACAARLAPGGIVAFRLPSAENFWPPQLVRRTASIDRALRAVFPDVLVVPGTTSVVMASATPLSRDPAPLRARFAERGLKTRLVTPDYITYLLTNDRVAQVASALAAARVPVNSDARPVCYQYTLTLWLAKFYPRLAWLDPGGAAVGEAPRRGGAAAAGGAARRWLQPSLAALAGLLVLRLLIRGQAPRRAIVVGVAGCAGMVAESLLLLAYQARRGVLYQDLGLLLMMFMAGLAAGAWAVDRAGSGRATSRRFGLALLLGLSALCAFLAARLRTGGGMVLAETGAWLLAAGSLSAAVFAHASWRADDQTRAVGPLYGADLVGGCVGSLAGSLLLIPLAGLTGGALLIAGLVILAALWV